MVKKTTIVLLSLLLVWLVGCSRGKVNDLEVARQELEEHAYTQAEIRLEKLIEKKPQNIEALCLLTAAYNRQDKTQKLEATVSKLREMGQPAIDKLVDIMKRERNMAEDMVKVLTLIGEPAVGALVPLLGDTSEYVREDAILILTKIGTSTTGHLREALDSSNALIRAGAIRILGDIGDKTAINSLVKKLKDADPAVKLESAIALYKLGDQSHVDIITNGLNSNLVSTRRTAAKAIRDMVEKPSVKPLLKAIKDSDIQVQTAVIQALRKTKDAQAVSPLIEAIKSKDSDVRNAAGDALKEIGEPAVMPLVDLVKQEQDIATLQKAIQTLGDIGDKRAIEPLEKIYAESKQSLVKQEAAVALNKIE